MERLRRSYLIVLDSGDFTVLRYGRVSDAKGILTRRLYDV
jgi:hypothetical protein